MDNKQNTPGNDSKREPNAGPEQLIQNPNPRANENIRVKIDDPKTQGNQPSYGVGSEITDGEDA